VIIRENLKSESVKKGNSVVVKRTQMCEGLILMMFFFMSFAERLTATLGCGTQKRTYFRTRIQQVQYHVSACGW